MAAARLDRSPPHNLGRPCAFHYRARAPNGEAREMSGMNGVPNLTQGRVAEEDGTAGAPAVPSLKPKVSIRNLKFYYGDSLALKSISLPLYAHKATAFIGPSGCGKSTLLRVLNRMYDLYPNQRAEGEVILDGVNVLAPDLDVNLLRARRHGIPEADAVSDVDLRQYRLRHPALRKTAQIRARRPRRI